MAERLSPPAVLTALALMGASVVLGLLAGVAPMFALGALLACAFVVLVFRDVTIGVVLMAFVASLDAIPALGGLSIGKFTGLLLGASWLAYVATYGGRQLIAERPLLTYTLVVFLTWNAITLAWAPDDAQWVDSMIRYVPNVLLFPIIYTAIREERHLTWTLLAVVAATLVSASLGIIGPAGDPSAVDVERAAGLAGGANELAATLVVGLVLCLGFATSGLPRPGWRPWFVAGAAMCTLGIFMSLSRGGLVALAGALVVAVVVAGPRWRGRAIAGALTLLVITFTYFALFASLPARERITQSDGGTGRADLWTVGWRMVEDRPLLGVGGGNFEVASIRYLLEPGALATDEFIVSRPKIAHNTVLEVLAETGIPGAALFLGIVAVGMGSMLAAARVFERRGADDTGLLCRATFVAMAGFLVAGMFISSNYSKLLWLALALGPAALAVARRPSSST